MKHTLVGYTGFVGGNLAAAHGFDARYNSKNIAESFGADNGLVVYAGMSAEKFLANADPEADLAVAKQALENMRRMRPQRLVLISTVDVYPEPRGVYEDTDICGVDAPAYGKNRLALEGWVREEWPDALILRLPGLFGKGLKKNFLYDALTLTPAMLTEQKYAQLAVVQPLVADSYEPGKPGFYKLRALQPKQSGELRAFFEQNDFNSLCFTDSRAVYQFYDLARLWGDIQKCLKAGLPLVNLGTRPLKAGRIYSEVFGAEFENHLAKPPAVYDMRTRFAEILGGQDGYLAGEDEVLSALGAFVDAWQKSRRN